jgi:hypothetical protein
MQSLGAPGRLEVVARVVASWPDGSASFAFATLEGAREALETLERHLANMPQT